MRDCPVCLAEQREEIFSMKYKIPDGWPLPSEITWYDCPDCGMIFGDGDFDQPMLDRYYQKYYGYGIYHADNVKRLREDANEIAKLVSVDACIVDFGGAGDDGSSLVVDQLKTKGFTNVRCVGAGEQLPWNCDVIYASHVLEHIYDLAEVMVEFEEKLAVDGLLIVDVPDSTGLLKRWRMPILDFNTKHINHFTLRTLLSLGWQYGFESVAVKMYELEFAPCLQVYFKRLDVANESATHVLTNDEKRTLALSTVTEPVNIWGMSDIVWHTMADAKLHILNYIDNDSAYRGQTYNGKPVLERPDNDAPIVIMAQAQRGRLIENIRKMGVKNPIIEI